MMTIMSVVLSKTLCLWTTCWALVLLPAVWSSNPTLKKAVVSPKRKIPTEFQAAALAKQLVNKQGFGTMMVRYLDRAVAGGVQPRETSTGSSNSFQDFPYGQVEQIAADCGNRKDIWVFSSPMELTLDSILHHSDQVSFHVREPNANDTLVDPMTKHRATFLGHLKPGPRFGEAGYAEVADCFFAKHPDAKAWEHLGGGHNFTFWSMAPEKIHYVGGFGNSHYIGDVSLSSYEQVPATPYCRDWKGCAANPLFQGGEERCCPYDDDNGMRACCVEEVAAGPEDEDHAIDEQIWI
eukprot:g15203.t1